MQVADERGTIGTMRTVPIGPQVARPRLTARQVSDLLGSWVGEGPLFRSLAGELELLIETERLPPGAVLPAERELASAISVSRNTVAAAYKRLGEIGLARSRRGSGTMVAPRRSRPGASHKLDGLFAGSLVDQPPEVDLTIAAPDCAPKVAEALRDHGRLLDAVVPGWEESHGYHPAGLPRFREAIAAHYTRRFGLTTTPDQVLATTGAQQAIDVVFDNAGTPGGAVVLETTTFPGAIDLLHRHGLRPVTVPPGGTDLDRLEAVLVTHRPSLVYLATTFHNPTGLRYSDAARQRLLELTEAHPHTVFVDDMVLSELDLGRPVPDPHRHPLAGAPNLVLIGSLSKLFWGGLRLAWIRAGAGVISRFTTTRAVNDLGSPMPTQAIGAALLDHHYDEVRVWRNRQLRQRADRLASALQTRLPELRFRFPDGGLSLWVEVPGGGAEAFAERCLDFGLAVVPGRLLSPIDEDVRFLRLPFVQKPELLDHAVDLLAAAWESWTRDASADR